MKKPRVVLLGARGFVGTRICAELGSREYEVVGLTSDEADLRTPMGAVVLRDVVRDGDVVVNAAAVVPARNTFDVAENIRIVESVAAGLSGRKLSQFVLISSDAVYGDVNGAISAASPVSADTLYGAMCIMREVAAQEIVAASTATIRPSAIYGFGDSHNSYGPNRFVRTALVDGEIRIFGEGAASRDHVHIEDVAKAVTYAIASHTHGTFNIGSATSISFLDLARVIRDAVGEEVRIESVGTESAPTHRCFDKTDINSWFPEFSPITIEAGVREVIDSYRRDA